MEKNIILNGEKTNFWLEDTGRLRNVRTGRWLKGGVNKGYHFYNLHFRGKQYMLYTHRAVAEYFIDNPDNLPIVHHKDGNKLNNIYTNLEWISIKDHNQIISEQKKQNNTTSKGKTRQKIDLNELPEMAQFRNSPYYLTKDGRVINVSKKCELRLEKSGNYLRFTGCYNLNGKHFLVHRAVWEAFNGPIPEGCDIDHIDGNPKNNSLENLQAITHSENIKKRNIDYSYAANNFYRG